MKKNRNFCIYLALICFSISLPIVGQNSTTDLENSDDSIFLDKTIINGVLENGFTYYIKPLKGEDSALKMNLVVKTGAFYEKASEVNFAHAIEHLAFKKTNNFPEGFKGNPKLLSALGMNLRDLRGLTSGIETNYFYSPSEKKESIEKGILWFSDILNGLDFSEESINNERGVLLQEYLSKKDENRILQNKLNKKLFPWISDSLNFEENNNNFSNKDLYEFYLQWYKPERMAISIVGNIDNPEYLVDLIEQRFRGKIENNNREKVLNPWHNYLQSEPKFGIVRSDSISSKRNSYEKPLKIQLFYRDKEAKLLAGTIEGLERSLKIRLIINVLNDRLKEAKKSFTNSTIIYSTHTSFFNNQHGLRPPFTFKIIVKSDLKKEKESLKKSIAMIKQLREYGLKESEFTNAKREMLNNFQEDEVHKTDYWIKEINNHFVENEPLTYNKNTYLRSFLKELSLEEVNSTIDNLISKIPEDIGMIFPKNYQTQLSSEAFTRNLISRSFEKQKTEYEEPKVVTEIMSAEEREVLVNEKPLSVKEGEMGSTEYRLKNGIKLILNPVKENTTSNDIIVRGFSSSGASCIPTKDYFSAVYAPSLILNTGIGKLSKFDLESFYQNSKSFKMGFQPYIEYSEAGVKARIQKGEIEDLMQLIYLFSSQPRQNREAFAAWQREQLQLTSRSVNNVNDLIDRLHVLIGDEAAEPYGEMRIERLKEVDFNKAVQYQKHYFGNPSDFTFIVTGDFEEKKMLPVIQKYLGSLKNHSTIGCQKKSPKLFKSGPVLKEVGSSKIANPDQSFYGLGFVKNRKKTDDWREEFKVKALGILAARMLKRLRFEEDLSLYHYSAGGNYNRPLNRYEIEFRLNCTLKELSLVQKGTMEIIEDLKNGNFSPQFLQVLLKGLAIRYENMEQLRWENESLYRFHKYGEPIIDASEIGEFFNSLSVKDIQKTAKKYLKDSYKFELRPFEKEIEKDN